MMENKTTEKMLTHSIPSLIVILAIPAIISNLISNIYNLADTYFVGTLGVSASGAIGILFTLMAILQAVAFMLGQGAGTNISRILAENDNDKASIFASLSIFSCLIFGSLLMIFGLTFIEPLMKILGSTNTILPYAKTYGTCILISAPAIMASLAINNILRYEGKTFLGMIGLSTGALLNVIMDPIFIFNFNLGIFGAGLSTCISQYISLILLLIIFFKKSSCKISFKCFKQMKYMIPILKCGFPSLIRQGLNSISSGTLNHFASIYGDDCVSAISIMSRVQGFMFSVGLGFGQGFQPVAGFNYQVKKYDRLKKAFFFTMFSSMTVFLISGTIVFIFAEPIVDLFIDSAKTIEIGSGALRMTCVGLVFLPLSAQTNMLYQSTGKSFTASILACLRGGLCFIPVLIILANLFGLVGVQIATGIGDIIAGLISIPFFIIYFININKQQEMKKAIV